MRCVSREANGNTNHCLDLKDALKLEPKNESVKEELKKVDNLVLKAKTKQGKVSYPVTSGVSHMLIIIETHNRCCTTACYAGIAKT